MTLHLGDCLDILPSLPELCSEVITKACTTGERIYTPQSQSLQTIQKHGNNKPQNIKQSTLQESASGGESVGRWPSNVLFSHHPECVEVGVKEVANRGHRGKDPKDSSIRSSFGISHIDSPHYAIDGKETVPDFQCHPECPVRELDRQMHSDSGGASSRFFKTFAYFPKASKRDRNEGLEGIELKRSDYRPNDDSSKDTIRERLHNSIPKANHHPTVKSTKLMEYLIKLVTPPGGVVLDCFMGSGSTIVAAKRLGFGFIGIEKEPEYFEIAKRRIDHAK
jgi:hypothetical protein